MCVQMYLVADTSFHIQMDDMCIALQQGSMGHIMCSENKTSDEDSSGVVAVVDQWRSCAICLEEMADCELMVHPPCDGTLCQSCLEVGRKQKCFI